ncbi:phytanoyl-CoA dioxygenase family protein [Thozetella sp. PMI_491]|nr:phytanoyl-CoA dioxygenase family protein [Thozetella sp. PMI_491]
MTDTISRQVGAFGRFGQKSAQSDLRVQKLIESTVENGFVVIQNAFTEAEIEEAKAELLRLSRTPQAGPAAERGRNPFEGLSTQRIYALIDKSRVFDKFALHPDVLALNDYFLEPGFLLNAYHSINIRPGEDPQTLHHDDGHINVPRPHNPFGAAIMVALDPYTETNGATVVIPKSHKWGSDRLPDRSETIPIIMPSGSIVYFLGTLWHGGGANTSTSDRRALTVQYCQPWMRPFENQILAVGWEKLDQIPPRLVDMLGYKVGAPFVGYVDGTSPTRAVGALLERYKNEAPRASKI